MNLLTKQHKVVDSFQTSLTDIRNADLSQLHQLSVGVGWPHRAEDWEFLRTVGHGFAAVDEIGRVVGSAMWFACGSTLATIGMLITSPRLQVQGTAQWLAEHVLENCAGLNVRVNSPVDVQRFFRNLDFRSDRTIYQCQGIVRLHAKADQRDLDCVRQLQPSDLPMIADLDKEAFGGDRSAMLGHLMSVATVLGLFEGDKLTGFSFCRPFGRGLVIGPVVAATDEEAIALTIPHFQENENSFVRVDTPCNKGKFSELLQAVNLSLYATVISMSRPTVEVPTKSDSTVRTYALASQTLG